MNLDALLSLDATLTAVRQPLQLGDGDVDEVLLLYYEELDDLSGRALNDEIERLVFIGAMTDIAARYLRRLFLLGSAGDEIPDAALPEYEEEEADNAVYIPGLAADIYNGRYSGDDEESAASARLRLRSRLFLWTATAAGVYGLGQLYNETVAHYRWDLGPTEEHCEDCGSFAGQVKTRVEWRATGQRPQARSLACKGYR